MTFAEIDDLVYNKLKLPQYQLDLVGIRAVSTPHPRQLVRGIFSVPNARCRHIERRLAQTVLAPVLPVWKSQVSAKTVGYI